MIHPKQIDEVKNLERARNWTRKRFNALREGERCHPSHHAAQAMKEAEKRYQLETFGVEGDCTENGGIDIIYLNTGDTYALTIVYHDNKFKLTSWGDIVEAAGTPDRY